MLPERKEKKVNPHTGHRERMKKRYLTKNFRDFEPHELLEMLLYYGVPRRDTNPLAHRLLNTFGSVNAVLSADREVLCSVEGVTPHVATLLNLVGDLHRYCAEEAMPLGVSLRTTADYVKFLSPRFDRLPVEQVWILCMDVLSRVVSVHQISSGTPLGSEVDMRRILRLALADNACKIVLAHNHPSGIALPSQMDINTTSALAKALTGMNIQLIDHLIYARDNECVSFRDTEELRPILKGEEYR